MNSTGWLFLGLSALVSLLSFLIVWSSHKAHQRDALKENKNSSK